MEQPYITFSHHHLSSLFFITSSFEIIDCPP